MLLTDIDGVFSSGIHCGIKDTEALDLGYIYVPNCVGSAIVQSQNVIRSVTLDHNESVFKEGPVKLMVINSGNANSVTGDVGIKHVHETVEKAANCFGCSISDVGVASTGIIGVPLPIQSILNGLELFSGDEKRGDLCAEAILTTDLVSKTAFRSIEIQGQMVHLSGITKGSGMISPNMATTLGFVVTNLAMDSDMCQSVLQQAINDSYNMLSVDTDSSTNDLVSLQSSGALALSLEDHDVIAFQHALTELCIDLAKQIARDGEGAEHFIETHVSGAQSKLDAKRVAKLVVDSPLVKTAIAGEDPNWGRIVMAIGKDPSVSIFQDLLCIRINDRPIFTNGHPEPLDRAGLKAVMTAMDIVIDIVIGNGPHEATAWGCDLTHGYIDINTEYN
ncbi:N-acetylglutamate synthase [Candidatus Marinamargulisbacteria bacterium SCGC AG-343-K17]|nr:N-acetylglutamate synthase [Candidatus Marinamargulisbacteria bacterium SCGC AG-343-K17]